MPCAEETHKIFQMKITHTHTLVPVSYTHLDVYKRQHLTSLVNKQHNIMNDVGMETNEHMILEELRYKVEDTYFTRTEIVHSSTGQSYPNHKRCV